MMGDRDQGKEGDPKAVDFERFEAYHSIAPNPCKLYLFTKKVSVFEYVMFSLIQRCHFPFVWGNSLISARCKSK